MKEKDIEGIVTLQVKLVIAVYTIILMLSVMGLSFIATKFVLYWLLGSAT